MNKIVYIIYTKNGKINISILSGYDTDGHAIFDTQKNWPVDFAGAVYKNELSEEDKKQLGEDLCKQNLGSVIRIVKISLINADTSKNEKQFYLQKTENRETKYLDIRSVDTEIDSINSIDSKEAMTECKEFAILLKNFISERNDKTDSFLSNVLDKKYKIESHYTPEALPQLEIHNIYE